MAGTVRLISPIGKSVVEEGRPASRLTSFDGRSIALMDNMKSNADVLLERIGANLRREYRGIETRRFRKPTTSSQPFDPSVMNEVRQRFDAAIAGMGD